MDINSKSSKPKSKHKDETSSKALKENEELHSALMSMLTIVRGHGNENGDRTGSMRDAEAQSMNKDEGDDNYDDDGIRALPNKNVRNAYFLAVDRYVKERRTFQTSQKEANVTEKGGGNEEEKDGEESASVPVVESNKYLELEMAAFELRHSCEELVAAGRYEREMLLFRWTRFLRSKLKTFENKVAAAACLMLARVICQMHLRQIQFEERVAVRKVEDIIQMQYASFEEKNDIDFRPLIHNSIAVKNRGYLDKIRLDQVHDYSLTLHNNYNDFQPEKNITDTCDDFNENEVGSFEGIVRYQQPASYEESEKCKRTFQEFKRSVLKDAILCMGRFHIDKDQISSIMITGDGGSGKTFLCQRIERLAKESHIQVVHPSIPVDIIRPTIGASVNQIDSLFQFSFQRPGCVVIVLDNIDKIISQEIASNFDNNDLAFSNRDTLSSLSLNQSLNIRSAFIRAMNELKQNYFNKVLVICSSTTCEDFDLNDYFDEVVSLQKPDRLQRQLLIKECLGIDDSISTVIESTLSTLANFMLGRTTAEIVGFCKMVISSECEDTQYHSGQHRLRKLELILSDTKNSTISSRSLEGLVSVNVMGSLELLKGKDSNSSEPELTLVGDDAIDSWEKLKNIIIPPLCRIKEFNELLHGGSENSYGEKVVCSGALLYGSSATGKSSLAYHCASVAASINPAMKLIEVACTSLIHKEVGGSERALKQLFRAARSAAPCILLLDGIENIAKTRGNDSTTEGTMDRLVSSFLIELDGIDDHAASNDSGRVAVIGITNDVKWIDPAVRRPGRLERSIKMKLPDHRTRKLITLQCLSDMSIDFTGASYFEPKHKDDLSGVIAMKTVGWNAAEIRSICREAAIYRVRELVSTDEKLTEDNPSISMCQESNENDFRANYQSAIPFKYFEIAIEERNKGAL